MYHLKLFWTADKVPTVGFFSLEKIKNVKKIIFRMLFYFFSNLEGDFHMYGSGFVVESKNSNEYGSFPDLDPQPDKSTDSLVTAMWCTVLNPLVYCNL